MASKKVFGFDKKRLIQWGLYWLVLGVGFFVLIFLITSTWIGVSVKQRCTRAEGKYGGDCVEAMVELVQDEEESYRERNYAIWALGQLGDKRALPVLEGKYTGVIPEREPYDEGISQYELKKAIKWMSGGVNISAMVWRKGK